MIESFGASDPGCVRANNEDYFLLVPELGLYVVADGMGGAQAGEHASRMAADTVREVMEGSPKPLQEEALESAFIEANLRVSSAAESNPEMEGMGTTMVAALENGADLIVASVGDSRLYTLHEGELKAITDDQTWVNEVGRRLGLDETTLKSHPMRHVLTMAIGVSDQLRVHTYRIPNQPGMQILMCSDGLHGVAPEADIVGILSSEDSLRDKCRRLIEAARKHGGPDNITALLLKMS